MLVFPAKFVQVIMCLHKFSNVILKRLRGAGDCGAWRNYMSGGRLRGVSDCAAGGPYKMCIEVHCQLYNDLYQCVSSGLLSF